MPANETSPSREFLLVAACCAWPLTPKRQTAIRAAAKPPFDWSRFLRIATVHRVEGLANNALSLAQIPMPAKIKEQLATRAAALTRENLSIASEAVRLQRLFVEARLPFLFIKGITLAVLAYGNFGLRHSKDIDILVAPEHADAAIALIERSGYRRHVPSPKFSETQLQSLRPISKDSSYIHPNGVFEVELHWRLFDNPHLMARMSVASSRREIPIAQGIALPTLGEEDLFAYLCMHGATHCWFRMKWLADIAALLASAPEGSAERLYRAAQSRGAGPAAAQALLLCNRLMGTALPDALALRLRASLQARWLERIGLWAMTTGNEEVALPDIPFGGTRIMFSHYLVASGLPYWLRELRIQLTDKKDMLMIPLPARLQFLYPVLRVPLWLYRRATGHAH